MRGGRPNLCRALSVSQHKDRPQLTPPILAKGNHRRSFRWSRKPARGVSPVEFVIMKVALSLAAVLALAVGLILTAVDPASAGCGGRWRCRGVVAVVPAPVPIPIRPVVVAPSPCGGCGGVAVAAPCGGGCGSAYYYAPSAYYAYWAQPSYFNGCVSGPGNCYWRRNCWYDSFGRRFCN